MKIKTPTLQAWITKQEIEKEIRP